VKRKKNTFFREKEKGERKRPTVLSRQKGKRKARKRGRRVEEID
jgi:hypothetical protein